MMNMVAGTIASITDLATKQKVEAQDVLLDVGAVAAQVSFPVCPYF